VQLRQNIEQEWTGRALAGEARHQARDVQRRIADDARARLPPASSRVGQNLAAATMLLCAMPEPSTTEGRRIQEELKNLMEDVTVRRVESSASRRQGCPPEHRAATSRFMREASVHTGRTRDATPAAPGRLGNEHHRRDRRARLDEKVRRGYHPRRGGRCDSEEDRSPSPEPPGPQAFSRAIRSETLLVHLGSDQWGVMILGQKGNHSSWVKCATSQPNGTFVEYVNVHSHLFSQNTRLPWCKEEEQGVDVDLQEFQDFDEFAN
jgi:hypothetical protein